MNTSSSSALMCGQGLLVTEGPHVLPLKRLHLTWSAKDTEDIPLAVRAWMWYMHDGAPAHFSRTVRSVLSNTYHDGYGQRRTPWLASTFVAFVSCGFLHVWTPKNPCVCSSCWQWGGKSPSQCECLSAYPLLPQHLRTDAAVHDEMCRGVRWIS
jgi:hypothetical protein